MIYRQLKGNDLTLTHIFYAADEETATDATGSVTVTVAREDGTALTGGSVGTNNGTDGNYDFALTAADHLDELDVIAVTWAATVDGRSVSETDYVHVVGGRYFSIPQLRSQRGVNNALEFTSAALISARDIVEAWIEDYTRTRFVPSYAREVADGDDEEWLLLTNIPTIALLEVSISGTVADTTDWELTSDGRITTDGQRFTRKIPQGNNIVVKYSWGLNHPPLDLQRAAVKLARHVLMESDSSIPERARMMQTEFAMFQLDVASEDNPTGIPEVDAILRRYRKNAPSWLFG